MNIMCGFPAPQDIEIRAQIGKYLGMSTLVTPSKVNERKVINYHFRCEPMSRRRRNKNIRTHL